MSVIDCIRAEVSCLPRPIVTDSTLKITHFRRRANCVVLDAPCDACWPHVMIVAPWLPMPVLHAHRCPASPCQTCLVWRLQVAHAAVDSAAEHTVPGSGPCMAMTWDIQLAFVTYLSVAMVLLLWCLSRLCLKASVFGCARPTHCSGSKLILSNSRPGA